MDLLSSITNLELLAEEEAKDIVQDIKDLSDRADEISASPEYIALLSAMESGEPTGEQIEKYIMFKNELQEILESIIISEKSLLDLVE